MTEKLLEIEEHYRDGVVVKRLINGIEYPLDYFPESIRVQEYSSVTIKQVMSAADAKKIYGQCVVSKGTS